jgi:hypothetical protein
MFAGGITPCHDENGGNIENYEIERGDRQDGGRWETNLCTRKIT